MDTKSLLEPYETEFGWNDETIRKILEEFIEDDEERLENFEIFLIHRADQEREDEELE